MFKNDEGKSDNGASVAYQVFIVLYFWASVRCARTSRVRLQPENKEGPGLQPESRNHTEGLIQISCHIVKTLINFSSAEVGWLPPLDDPKWGYGAKSTF